jgi:hypothetical protein
MKYTSQIYLQRWNYIRNFQVSIWDNRSTLLTRVNMENDTIFALILHDVCKDKIQMFTSDLVLILWNWKQNFGLHEYMCI